MPIFFLFLSLKACTCSLSLSNIHTFSHTQAVKGSLQWAYKIPFQMQIELCDNILKCLSTPKLIEHNFFWINCLLTSQIKIQSIKLRDTSLHPFFLKMNGTNMTSKKATYCCEHVSHFFIASHCYMVPIFIFICIKRQQ